MKQFKIILEQWLIANTQKEAEDKLFDAIANDREYVRGLLVVELMEEGDHVQA